MSIAPFKLERYFALYEFKVKYLLSPSDCESLSMAELLQMAAPATLELWQDLLLGYTESQGHPLLRDEIAKLYRHIPPENVLIAAPEEAIFIAMQTLLRPGDQVVALAPAYQSLHEIARSIGCEVTGWMVEPGIDNTWHLDIKLQGEGETVFPADVIRPLLGPIFFSPPLHNVLPIHLSPGLTPAAGQHLHINVLVGTTTGKASKGPAHTTCRRSIPLK